MRCDNNYTRAHLGCVTPLGQLRSVYKSNIERHFLEFWGKMVKWPWWSISMTPFSISAERKPRGIAGANLVILAQIYYKLSCKQAKFTRILHQNGQNDLEDQGEWPLYSIPAESIPGCMFSANLVIPVQICDELSCGQTKVPRIMSQNDQNDLEGQGQWPPFSILVWWKFGYSSSNLWQVIVGTR